MKYLSAASRPAFWPAIARGVMPGVEHIEAIRRLNPKTLIDVGANKGQFSLVARCLFPDIEIHAFEPLDRERKVLGRVVSSPIEIYAAALGATAGQAAFFVTSRADSSSLLQPGAGQQVAYNVTLASSKTVQVAKLGDVLDLSRLQRPTLIKIDVQGGELDVLRGAGEGLNSLDVVYCEASFVTLYENQPLANELVVYLTAAGFELRGVFNSSYTTAFGATQADFLFLRATADADL